MFPQDDEVRKELLKEKEAENAETEKVSLLQMFKTPNLRVNAFLVNIIW